MLIPHLSCFNLLGNFRSLIRDLLSVLFLSFTEVLISEVYLLRYHAYVMGPDVLLWNDFENIFFGQAIAVISFFLLKKQNLHVAFGAFLFITFSSFNIELSRFARFYLLNATLFTATVYYGWKYIETEKNKYHDRCWVWFKTIH